MPTLLPTAATAMNQASEKLPFETVTIGTVFSGATFLGLFYLIMRYVGPWRKHTTDATDALIVHLNERLDKVEAARATDKRMHYIQMARIEARHAAQRALDRHKFNNADANLDALLRILEVSPEKAPEAARQAREARERQRKEEQLEAVEIHKAEMVAVAMAEKELASEDDD